MSLRVTLDLPADLEEKLRRSSANLDADIKEAYALELFRSGRISHYELSRTLGLDRIETDAWLKRRNVFEGSLTRDDLEADWRTIQRVTSQVK